MRVRLVSAWLSLGWLVGLGAPGAGAADRVPVAGLEIQNLGGVEPEQMAELNRLLLERVSALTDIRPLNSEGLRKTLAIKGESLETRCSDAACASALGRALRLRWLAMGSLMRFGGTYVLKLRLVDAEQQRVAASASRQIRGGAEALRAELPKVVQSLFSSAAAKLHPERKGPRAQKPTERSQAEQKTVAEFERMLNRVEKSKARKEQIEQAWQIVHRMATDGSLHVSVRRHALRKFLGRYRQDNPYYRQAYAMYQALEPALLEIQTIPSGAMITIGGTSVGSSPLSRELPAGSYRVVATRDGYRPSAQRVTVTKGQNAGVSLLLTREVEGHPFDTWGHISFWSGLGLAAFGGASVGLAVKYANDYETTGRSRDADRSDTWAGLMWTGLGAGAALMATGVVLWLLEPPASERVDPATAAGLAPTGDGRGAVLTVGGRW